MGGSGKLGRYDKVASTEMDLRKCLAEGDLDRAQALCRELEKSGAAGYEVLSLRAEVEFACGRLDRAEALLADATRMQPARKDARLNHRYGQVLHDLGKIDRAVAHYRKALRMAPPTAQLYRDLGAAYEAKEWPNEAAESFRHAIALDPWDELAHAKLGRVLQAQGDVRGALSHFGRAAALKLMRPLRRVFGGSPAPVQTLPPTRAEEEIRAAFEARRFGEAESKIVELLRRDQRNGAMLVLYSRICGKTGRIDEAIHQAQNAVALEPANAEFHLALGEAFMRPERLEEAAACFNEVLRLDPGNAQACANLALVEQKNERPQEAEQASTRALELDGASAHVQNVRAYVLIFQDRPVEAEAHCREAIRLDPGGGSPYFNLASSLKEQGRIDAARAAMEEGNRRLNDEALATRFLSDFELDFGEIEMATQHARRALMLEPENVDANMSLANLLLLSGRYDEGWRQYEWRKRYRNQAALHALCRDLFKRSRQWTGSSLEGKSIIVHGEQALGEQILFGSMLPLLTGAAKSVTVLCDERTTRSMARSWPQVQFIGAFRGNKWLDYRPDRDYDFWCALGSLPALFNLGAKSIPPSKSYLKPDPAKVQRWRERLATLGTGMKVGIAWRGGTMATGRLKRSMPLETLRPLFDIPGIHWLSLQYDKNAEKDIQAVRDRGVRIVHWPDGIDDFEEHVAFAAALDHRITVCGTVAHVCGALGATCWVLSPPATIWPYGLGTEMPWYPSVRIYRQQRYKDWAEPLRGAERDLRALAAGFVGSPDSG